jgi:hypothetical protein
LPDGTETAVWTYETREFRAYRTRWACGWRGSGRYPATDTGEDAVLDEWDHDRRQPLVRAEARTRKTATVPCSVRAIILCGLDGSHHGCEDLTTRAMSGNYDSRQVMLSCGGDLTG